MHLTQTKIYHYTIGDGDRMTYLESIFTKYDFVLTNLLKIEAELCKSKQLQRPSVNFANVLHKAFTLIDPGSINKIDNLTFFFMHLGSERVKAECM